MFQRTVNEPPLILLRLSAIGARALVHRGGSNENNAPFIAHPPPLISEFLREFYSGAKVNREKERNAFNYKQRRLSPLHSTPTPRVYSRS